MENLSSLKIGNLPLTASTLIYSSTMRNGSRHKSKSRKTCETKNSSIHKPRRVNSNAAKNSLKKDVWKCDTIKRSVNNSKRTQSQCFNKVNGRYSMASNKYPSSRIRKSKNDANTHYFSGSDYSLSFNPHSPAERSHMVRRSIFESTGCSKPSKYQ